MTVYETLYILRPDLGEELVDQQIAKYQALLNEQGVKDLEIQYRGKRRLAYDIGKFREGVYIQMNYEAEGTAIAIMERAMRLSDEVIRYMTIKPDAVVAAEEESEAA
jgi:small subunit ribosomal protein S6